jgi:hypothetical protein
MSERRSRTPPARRPAIATDPRAWSVTDPRARAVADTRERFLREITTQVPADRIAELHLFRPMVRGGTETGVAVIAAMTLPDPPPAAGAAAPDQEPVMDSPYADDASRRHTVFTARYSLALKGAERGKWEFGVVADADAPLVTVDTVVRGVQRRAGDDEEPERLTAEALRAALDGLPCTETR